MFSKTSFNHTIKIKKKLASYTAYGPPEAPAAVVGRADTAIVEAQVPRVASTADRTRPVVPAASRVAKGAAIDAAGPHKVKWVVADVIKANLYIATIGYISSRRYI